MAQQVFGPAAVVSVLNRAFTNTSPSNAVFANQVATAGTTEASQLAFAKSFGASFATGKTAADLSALLMTNMGITNAALSAALTDYIAANGTQNVGIIAWQLSSILSNLENDGTYGAAAKAWNAEVTAAYEYSANPKNTTPSTGTTTGNEAGTSTVLTTGQDVLTGGAGNDFFRGVAGQPVGNQEQSTFNSSDIIDGAAGQDSLILNLVGNYNGGARVKNIETLKLGTNIAGGIAFDYNVNAGFNEIADVRTIVADQINGAEILTVNNVVRTIDGEARILPTLSWENDSNTQVAGVVNYNYRAAELTGATDNQVVSLDSVNNGVLNLAAAIETVTLRSVAGERVTLLNSTNQDAANAGVNNVAADIISNGTLTTVNIEAAAEVGKVGGRVAVTGLIDRVATDGVGDAATGTAANLLSVGARVTTVDANTSTANVNVQFLAKVTGAATNVAFTGGAGNDYAEFEIGNVNANGGAGNDVFAFVTQRNGVTNSTFGAGDTIVGGAGTDTIQIGENGAGNYNIGDSEWASKSGIEVVDLRGAVNTIALSSAFVAAPDTGVKLTVTTDNMVVGGAAPSNLEYASVNTIDLRLLSGGQGINFVGGQGSDRLILSDSTFTSAMTLAGGSNVNNAGVAVAADYDTLTVSNSAVLDRTDLANVSGFEGLVLTKTVTGATTTVIELTEAFLLANSVAVNSATTSIDDRVFQVGTAAGASGTALTAGDVVRIDVTDLFTVNNNTVKASVAARQVDVSTLTAAGVTVQYVYNGTTYNNLAALTAAFAGVGGAAVLNGADGAGQTGVVGAAVALPVPVTGANVVFTAIDGNSTTGWNTQGNLIATAQADTINVGAFVLTAAAVVNGGAGVNTLVVRDGANTAAATVANVTELTFDATGVAGTNDLTVTQAQHALFTGAVTAAGTGVNGESITVTTAGAVAALAGVENYLVSAGGANNVTVNAATTGVNITGNAANVTTVTVGGNTVSGTYALANAADVIVATTGANITGVNAGALTTAEALTLTGTITMTAAQYGNGTATGLTSAAITAGGVADRINISDVFASAIGANATAVETVALQSAGNDTANVTTGVAGSFLGTLDISAGGNDTITLTNAAHNAATSNSMTIAGFSTAAGANMDVIRVVEGGTAISGPLTAIAAGSNTAYAGAANSVIEITGGGVVNLLDVADTGTVEVLIANAVGAVATGGAHTVIVYGGTGNANAGIYSVNLTGGAADAVTGNMTVELLGIVTGVGADNLAGIHFAI